LKRLQSVKPEIKAQIKAEAGRRILTVAPEWKQRNLIARSIELRDILDSRALTVDEQAEKDSSAAIWNIIKSIRAHSGELESDIDAGKAIDLAAPWHV
jgi:hypothetical protein